MAAKPKAVASAPAANQGRDAPVQHISPEEALAHIQALLDVKQDRARQTPGWPGAGDAMATPAPNAAAAPVPDQAPASTTPAVDAPRSDVGKRGD